MAEARVPNVHQEWDRAEGCLVGRDPRRMTAAEFSACGMEAKPLLAVIRAKCLDCCCDNAAEVRRCGDIRCPNWPYRMSANPFRRQDLTDDQRAECGRRLNQERAAVPAHNSRLENAAEAPEVERVGGGPERRSPQGFWSPAMRGQGDG
jgi:hypothetical protein